MRSKVWQAITILRFWPESDAVREHRLEDIEVPARKIFVSIHNQPGKMLTHSLPHNPRLAKVHLKSFFHQNGRDMS